MGNNRRRPLAERVEFKSATAGQVGGVIADENDPMVFDIIGSVTGVLDEVKDICLPGCFERTLTKRTPKVIKDHDWGQRLGVILQIKELRPGDPNLPATLPNGDPWPAEAGALVAKVRLFNSPEGLQAAERWRLDPAQQFSIGYIARKASHRKSDNARLLADVDLLELSDVLWGAMPLCGMLPGALATKMLTVEGKDAALLEDEDLDDDDRLLVDPLEDDDDTEAAFVAALHRYGLEDYDWGEVDELAARLDEHGQVSAEDGQEVEVAQPVEIIEPEPGTANEGTGRDTDAEPGDGTPLGGDDDQPAETDPDGEPTTEPDAQPDAEPVEQALVIADGGALHAVDATGAPIGEGKAAGGADRNRGNAEQLRRWYVSGEGAAKIRWGTDGDLTRCHRLAMKHMTSERAWGYCQLRHKDALGTYNSPTEKVLVAAGLVTPTTHTEAKAVRYDPALERGEFAGTKPAAATTVLEAKDFPRFPGTLEERISRVHAAVCSRLGPVREFGDGDGQDRPYWDHIRIDATWNDRVIATRVKWSGGVDDCETYELGYTWDGEHVTLGEPTRIRLQITATALPGEDGPAYEDDPSAGAVAIAVKDAAAQLTAATALEGKAGRVLSMANAKRLEQALQHLLDVAKAAGITVLAPGEAPPKEKPARPSNDPDSTAPSAQEGAEVKLLAAEVEAALARFANA